jgi:hypothetical protein
VVPRWTYTRTKLETADRAKENLQPTAFSSTRRSKTARVTARRITLHRRRASEIGTNMPAAYSRHYTKRFWISELRP